MSQIPQELRYTRDHEWLKCQDGKTAEIGITHFAQESLGDITFVELPDEGEEFGQGDTFGTVESVKAASDLFLPVSGKVVAVNEGLEDDPGAVNNDPYGNGWIIRIEISDESELEQLLSPEDYAKVCEEG